MNRAPSRKQQARVKLTADQVRLRESRKQALADAAYFRMLGGESAWRAELTRRQAERNARTRAYVEELRQLAAERTCPDHSAEGSPIPSKSSMPEQLGLDLGEAA